MQSVFGRADAWLDWADFPKDRPLVSLWRVLVSIGGLFRKPDTTGPVSAADKAQIEETIRASLARANAGLSGGDSRARGAAAVVALLLLALPCVAIAQTTIVRPLAQHRDCAEYRAAAQYRSAQCFGAGACSRRSRGAQRGRRAARNLECAGRRKSGRLQRHQRR